MSIVETATRQRAKDANHSIAITMPSLMWSAAGCSGGWVILRLFPLQLNTVASPAIAPAVCSVSGIRSVTRAGKDRFEAAKATAFSTDPVARWAWPDPLQFLNIFVPLVTLFGGKSFEHGSAHVIGDFFGVVQWLPPGVQPDDGPIGELFEQNMSEPKLGGLLSLFEQTAGFHPHEPHWYIPLVGIDPIFYGRGYGTELMRHGLVACDRDQQPAYLVATSPVNRRFYERHGFRALAEIRSGDSPPLFPMLREPQ